MAQRRRTRTARVAALAISVALLWVAPARGAGGEQVRLEWLRGEGAESCPTLEAVERDLTERLERDPLSPSAPRALRVILVRREGRWLARIQELIGEAESAPRELSSDGPDCAGIVDATLVVVKVLILLPPPPALSPPAPVTPPAVASPFAPGSALPQTNAPPSLFSPLRAGPQAPRPLRATIHARSAAAFAVLPRPAFAMAFSAGIGTALIEGSAGMLWLPEVSTDDHAFAFGLTSAWIGACVHPLRSSRVSLGACGSVLGGAYHSVVLALDQYQPVETGDRAWAALSFSLLSRVALTGPLSAELGVDVLVPLTRYSYRAGADVRFLEPSVGLLSFFGLGVSIP